MYWLSFLRPDSPSFFSASSDGTAAVISWMMMLALMYGMMFEREHRHAPQRAAGEHVEHAEDAAAVLLQHLGHHAGIDAGHRDVGAETVNDQRAEGEPDALLEFGRLRQNAEIEICRKLFGSRSHGSSLVSRVLFSAGGTVSASCDRVHRHGRVTLPRSHCIGVHTAWPSDRCPGWALPTWLGAADLARRCRRTTRS